jgi:hypothetical protein
MAVFGGLGMALCVVCGAKSAGDASEQEDKAGAGINALQPGSAPMSLTLALPMINDFPLCIGQHPILNRYKGDKVSVFYLIVT